jgi:hypothetical protein
MIPPGRAVAGAQTRVAGTYLMGGGDGYLRLDTDSSGSGVRMRVGDGYRAWMEGSTLRLRTGPRVVAEFSDGTRLHQVDDYGLLPSRSIPGDWDATHFKVHTLSDKELGNPIASCPPLVAPLPSFLHRIEESQVPEYFEATVTTTATAVLTPLSDAILAAHPADLHVRALCLDALQRTENWPELERRLTEWGAGMVASGNEMLGHAVFCARESLRGARLSASGRNAFDLLHRSYDSQASLVNLFRDLRGVYQCEAYVTPIAYRHSSTQARHLDVQVFAKLARVCSDFLMMQGRRAEALDLSLSMFRAGQLMRCGDSRIASFIGGAVQNISCAALKYYALNCCESAPQLDDLWARLQAINALECSGMPTSATCVLPGFPFSASEESAAGSGAALTRDWHTRALFQLLRTAVAARRHLVQSGRLPVAAADFAPYLPGGPPTDPFTSQPLRWNPTAQPWVCYSAGPDKQDNLGRLEYDPTNGTFSAGDIVLPVLTYPEYPYPPNGIRAATAADLRDRFPMGLPPDCFADSRTRGYTIVDTRPVIIYSFGPDANQREAERLTNWVPQECVPTVDRSGRLSFKINQRPPQDYVPTIPYDATNGLVSGGDLLFHVAPR